MDHVLSKVYIARSDCESFLATVVSAPKLAKPTPVSFWKRANFLRVQQKGESQQVMLALFEQALQQATGLTLNNCGDPSGPNVYLDDCIFTATHVRWDLIDWVKSIATQSAEVHVIAIAMHKGRTDYTTRTVQQEAGKLGKTITLHWWRLLELSDCSCFGETECLHPRSFPANDPHVSQLLQSLAQFGHPATPRTVLTTTANQVFASEARREVLGQGWLKAGARIKYALCPQLKQNHWPLGYDVFKCPGFGSMLVTYRNCPNNCPLALWAGDPWIPLFPRKTNAPTQHVTVDDDWLAELLNPPDGDTGTGGPNALGNPDIPF
jgi:hypothetical protein